MRLSKIYGEVLVKEWSRYQTQFDGNRLAFARWLKENHFPERSLSAVDQAISAHQKNNVNVRITKTDYNQLIPTEFEGSIRELATRLNKQESSISITSWENRIQRAQTNGVFRVKPHIDREVIQLHAVSESPEDLWERVEKTTAEAIIRNEGSRWAQINMKGEGHIGIAFASDQHIGNAYTDHARMREDAEMVRNTHNCYAIHAGDFIDNFVIDKPRPSMKAQIPPGMQWKLCDHYLSMFGDDILAVVAGNHDLWTKGLTDFDPLAAQVKKTGALYHAHELNLRIKVGQVFYHISVRHKRRGNSSLNPARVVKKMWEDGEHDFDIGVVGHHHTPVIEPFTRHGLERWAIRPGAYKMIDSFSEMIGFQAERATCPLAILSPETRSIQVFSDLRDGIRTLNVLNGVDA
jgi:predicted phosphodiesterase